MFSLRAIAELKEDRQARGVAEIGTASQPIAGGWMTFGEVSTRGFRPAGERLSEVLTELSIRMVNHPRCDSFLGG